MEKRKVKKYGLKIGIILIIIGMACFLLTFCLYYFEFSKYEHTDIKDVRGEDKYREDDIVYIKGGPMEYGEEPDGTSYIVLNTMDEGSVGDVNNKINKTYLPIYFDEPLDRDVPGYGSSDYALIKGKVVGEGENKNIIGLEYHKSYRPFYRLLMLFEFIIFGIGLIVYLPLSIHFYKKYINIINSNQ